MNQRNFDNMYQFCHQYCANHVYFESLEPMDLENEAYKAICNILEKCCGIDISEVDYFVNNNRSFQINCKTVEQRDVIKAYKMFTLVISGYENEEKNEDFPPSWEYKSHYRQYCIIENQHVRCSNPPALEKFNRKELVVYKWNNKIATRNYLKFKELLDQYSLLNNCTTSKIFQFKHTFDYAKSLSVESINEIRNSMPNNEIQAYCPYETNAVAIRFFDLPYILEKCGYYKLDQLFHEEGEYTWQATNKLTSKNNIIIVQASSAEYYCELMYDLAAGKKDLFLTEEDSNEIDRLRKTFVYERISSWYHFNKMIIECAIFLGDEYLD